MLWPSKYRPRASSDIPPHKPYARGSAGNPDSPATLSSGRRSKLFTKRNPCREGKKANAGPSIICACAPNGDTDAPQRTIQATSGVVNETLNAGASVVSRK
jgi:hypothetical protein